MKTLLKIGPSRVCRLIFLVSALFSPNAARAEKAQQPTQQMATQITQHGITWTFDKPYPAGQFVTGDFWVVGPLKILGVTPAPGPAAQSTLGEVKSRYGAVAMRDDTRLRNGSMIVTKPGAGQGYDSRLNNYDPKLSVAYPLVLEPNQSLISTVSNETFPAPVLLEAMMWRTEKSGNFALQSAAVLTCLDKAPPPDAFRPPYAGSEKPIYRTANLRWDILPRIKPVGPVPSLQQFERYLQRPWLDHISTWLFQVTGPYENQANYGREFSRVGSIASLMLMLDIPRERKQKLMTGFVQWGIDLHGLAKAGRSWPADGGHWNGRKWPILFAGLMLGDKEMQNIAATTLFSEDQQTYFGKGWAGQTALYQMILHTFPRPPYEEKAPDAWDDSDKRSEAYRMTVSGGWPGTALAVQLMKAKPLWNHDAFFAYADRWMSQDDPYAARRGQSPRPTLEGKSLDPFVDAMWAAYRPNLPEQPGASENRKWVWNEDKKSGRFVPNP